MQSFEDVYRRMVKIACRSSWLGTALCVLAGGQASRKSEIIQYFDEIHGQFGGLGTAAGFRKFSGSLSAVAGDPANPILPAAGAGAEPPLLPANGDAAAAAGAAQ